MICAVILDFDGLILDTETPAFESWREIYAGYGHELDLEQWQAALGRAPGEGFDALAHLATLVGAPFDAEAVRARRQARKRELCDALSLLPGVCELLDQADALGLPCAVASSSRRDWVEGYLGRHGIRGRFVCVCTADDVERAKPAPDVFLSAAASLGVPAGSCVVFEDSPNGILAARAAGMYCVAVPCPVSALVRLPPADARLGRLDERPLVDLIAGLVAAPPRDE